MQLAHSYPHLQLKLQDLPECVIQAQDDIWPKKCPEAIRDGRIEFKAMDFFVESPIKGCDIYYVSQPPSCDGYRFHTLDPAAAEEHHVRDKGSILVLFNIDFTTLSAIAGLTKNV